MAEHGTATRRIEPTEAAIAIETAGRLTLKARRAAERLDAETLLRCLVVQVEHGTAHQSAHMLRRTPEGVEEILLQLNIDGSQYILTRSLPVRSPDQVSLSPRELAIVQLIAKGLPNKTIGEVLEISQWTVATHLRRIFVKLDVTSRAAMVARILEDNLL